MTKKVVLFDLGGTLVHYFERSEFSFILKQCIIDVQSFLNEEDLLNISSEIIWRRVKEQDGVSRNYHVKPLGERLARIFQVAKVLLRVYKFKKIVSMH